MKTTYRLFDYEGTAVARPGLDSPSVLNVTIHAESIFKHDRTIKRVEVFIREDDASMWDEERVGIYYAKDFK